MEILIIMVANEFQADSVLYGSAGAVPGNLSKLGPSVLILKSKCIYQVGLLYNELNFSTVNALVFSPVSWNICHSVFYSFSRICDPPQQKIRR